MEKKVLIITDNSDGAVFKRYGETGLRNCQGDIITLGLSSTLFSHRCKSLLNKYLPNHSFINLNEYYLEAQRLTKEYCLHLKMELPRRRIWGKKCLLDFFCAGNFNLWWFTLFSEMGTFRIKFIDQIYFLTITKLILLHNHNYQSIYLDLKDNILADTLSEYFQKQGINSFLIDHQSPARRFLLRKVPLLYWILSLAVFVAHEAYKNILLRVLNIGFLPPRTDKESYLFFSFFPLLWKKTGEHEIRTALYGNLLESLSQGVPSYHAVFIARGVNILKQGRMLRAQFYRHKIIPIERFCTLKDIALLVRWKMIRPALVYNFFLRKKIKESYMGFDISRMIDNVLSLSVVDHEMFRDIMIYAALKNLLGKYTIKGILHASEFQCYEKAIWYAAQGRTKVTALQHSAIGNNWLNYYFDPRELSRYIKGEKSAWDMPLPSLYLTSGAFPYKIMRQNGMPEEMLKICGAFRYDGLAGYVQAKPSKEALRRKYALPREAQIVMVFSGVNVSESVDMLHNITLALRESYESVRVLFKSHPLKIIDHEARKIMENSGLQGSIVPVDANYLDYIALSDVTCFCNSTIGLESIALGTHAIGFDNIHSMCSFDMIETEGAVLHVRSLSDLKEAFNKVFSGDRHLEEIEGSWPSAIYETFYLLDGNAHERVYEYLEGGEQ